MTHVFDSKVISWLLTRALIFSGLLFAALSGHAQSRPSRMNCSPVTAETKVPFIETAQLPNVSRDPLYFEACTDLDTAWTPQSYPDVKYVPKRTTEQEARVNLLLQGVKRYVAADSEDWVSYVNSWLGSSLPPPSVERRKFPEVETTRLISYARSHPLTKFGTSSEILGVYGQQDVSPQGATISTVRELSITGLDTKNLCITPVDLKNAFENQPGYLLRPMSVRSQEERPTPEELAKLGGQWFGYEVHVLSDAATAQSSGLILIGFSFKPCAGLVTVKLTKKKL